ncbi:MAG: hypothetical protein WA277_10165 [Nitrospirota bacterium]
MAEGQSKWLQDFFDKAEQIKLKDPLAVTLGAMSEDEVFVFKYPDAVKLAGHSCPAVAGAYMITLKALKALYGNEIPVRGEIRVAVLGGPLDMAYGPISQVISFITGAAPITGFGGLGGKFIRRNKLVFDEEHGEFNAFIFQRTDNNKTVKVAYNPSSIPADERMSDLMPLVVSGTASKDEHKAFIDMWQGKVKKVLLEADKFEGVFEVTEVKDYKF